MDGQQLEVVTTGWLTPTDVLLGLFSAGVVFFVLFGISLASRDKPVGRGWIRGWAVIISVYSICIGLVLGFMTNATVENTTNLALQSIQDEFNSQPTEAGVAILDRAIRGENVSEKSIELRDLNFDTVREYHFESVVVGSERTIRIRP